MTNTNVIKMEESAQVMFNRQLQKERAMNLVREISELEQEYAVKMDRFRKAETNFMTKVIAAVTEEHGQYYKQCHIDIAVNSNEKRNKYVLDLEMKRIEIDMKKNELKVIMAFAE